ncbi:MAG: formimidoylglutamate deiminase [Pseudomonadota bacterium]
MSTALLPSGWMDGVRIRIGDDGRIEAVEVEVAPKPDDMLLRDAALLPAPCNLHSHTFQRALTGRNQMRGAGEDSFWTWRTLMYQSLDRMTPDDIEAIAALAFVEMLEAGFGAVGEFHYVHHDATGRPYSALAETSERIMAAASAAGIGLTLLPVLYMQAGADGRGVSGGQRRFANSQDRFACLIEAARTALAKGPDDWAIGVAPHSLRAVPLEVIASLRDMAPEGPLHIHAAEQTAEVDEILAVHGARPIQLLLDQIGLDSSSCVVHATHMAEDEVSGLAASGAVAGLCPVTEADLGDGLFAGVSYTDSRGIYGVGTDSNVRISLRDELRVLDYGQRLLNRKRVVMADPDGSTGRALFDAACLGGARALGRSSGDIRPGAWADLLTLDRNDLTLHGQSGDALLDAWVFSGNDQTIRDVWSAGRHVVREGEHVARAEIEARFRKTLDRLFR